MQVALRHAISLYLPYHSIISLPADKTTSTSGDPQPRVTSSSVSTSAPGMLAGWRRDAVAKRSFGWGVAYNPVGSFWPDGIRGSGSGRVGCRCSVIPNPGQTLDPQVRPTVEAHQPGNIVVSHDGDVVHPWPDNV